MPAPRLRTKFNFSSSSFGIIVAVVVVGVVEAAAAAVVGGNVVVVVTFKANHVVFSVDVAGAHCHRRLQ